MRKFKTESKKLLDLMINSVYTNREIFLRELISNASDAEDKLYFKSLTDSSIKIGKDDLTIRVAFDKDARTITVSDRGIGMDGDAMEKNLGTIAHSDSMEFKNENAEQQGQDVDIIGQFGVGFYSGFMVAKQMRVVSKPYGSDKAWQWVSDGIEGYTISETEKESWGTDVILTLKDPIEDEDYDIFLSEGELKSLIRQYSNYVRYPIIMNVEKTRELPKPEDAGDDYKPEHEHYFEDETINSMTPIWKRRKSEVSQEEYNEFYKSNFHDFADPISTTSVHAEGTLTYDALLFIPGRRPYDLYSRDYEKGLELYSSNVLIMEKCADLLPDYYNFVRGVVNSEDLTLNISRETLQQNRQLRAIAKKVEKKIKSELEKMRDNDRETYEGFFKNFGRGLKYGIYTSYGMESENLRDLLLFYSAKQEKMITLAEYVEAMPEDQKDIYYAFGESQERLGNLATVGAVTKLGFDVLLCTQDVDEFCMMTLGEYDGHAIKNVNSDDLDLETEDEKEAAEAIAKENEGLLGAMKEVLGDKVTRVAVTTRLSEVPAVVTTEGPISLEMERMFAMSPEGNMGMHASRVLELNASSDVFPVLKAAQAAGDTDKVALYTSILYNQALIAQGIEIDNPTEFAQQVTSLLK